MKTRNTKQINITLILLTNIMLPKMYYCTFHLTPSAYVFSLAKL